MTFTPLSCYAANNMPSGITVSAAATWMDDGELRLEYRLNGAIETLRMPTAATAKAIDGLWHHTCCEAFIAARGASTYREFNFSPSTQWAAYHFGTYRQRDTVWLPSASPTISLLTEVDGIQLVAHIPASLLPAAASLDLGLTTILETHAGDKSYWALRHCGQQPDFHLRDSFTLHLTRP
ncbi:MAG: DOMON-like domain-containing protein [Betaproteobacteria bacterium]|nr:DOMON-like domain-containing protein [Betaproteobacteria bacterium]